MRDSTIVYLQEEVAQRKVWISNADLKSPSFHVPSLYFYRSNDTSNFFNAKILKESLSKVLVPFYPMAGRLHWDKDDRVEINCDNQGVLFVEANTNAVIDDFGDFTPTPQFCQLIPTVDYSCGIEAYPLLVLQVCVTIFFNYL